MSLAEKIMKTFNKRKFDELTLVPSDGGRFEIEVNGKLVYSKLETGQFPEEDAILKALQPYAKN